MLYCFSGVASNCDALQDGKRKRGRKAVILVDADGGVAATEEEEEEGGQGEGAAERITAGEGVDGTAAGKEGGGTSGGKALVGSDALATGSQPAKAADHTGEVNEGSRKVRGDMYFHIFVPFMCVFAWMLCAFNSTCSSFNGLRQTRVK